MLSKAKHLESEILRTGRAGAQNDGDGDVAPPLVGGAETRPAPPTRGGATVFQQAARRRSAFTLVEMIVAMSVMSLLIGGLAATLMLAMKAVPSATTPVGSMVQAERAVWELAADLATLRAAPLRTSTSIGIVVPDRDSNGTSEMILFAWSGVPGDPLTRSYNNGTAATIIDSVREFVMTYDLQDVTTATPPAANESAEVLLAQYIPTDHLHDDTIDRNNWVGQYFMPTLPADATAWKITKVTFRLHANGKNDGLSHLQICLPTIANVPSTTIVDEAAVLESTLSTVYTDMTYSFTKASGLSPSSGMCVILAGSGGGAACDARTQNSQYSSTGSNLVSTSNAGSTWTSSASQSMSFSVYGTITSPGQGTSTTAHYLRGIHIKLRAGSDQSPAVETTVRITNLPEVGG